MQLLAEQKRKAGKAKKVAAARSKAVKASGAAFYKQMLVEHDYTGEDYDNFNSWLHKGEESK